MKKIILMIGGIAVVSGCSTTPELSDTDKIVSEINQYIYKSKRLTKNNSLLIYFDLFWFSNS